MDTLAATLKGGHSGPALIKGNAEGSPLYQLITLHADDDDRMPTDAEPLNPEEQRIIKQWIDAGAPWEGTLVAREKPKTKMIAKVDSPFANRKVNLRSAKEQATASQHIDYLIIKELEAKGQKAGASISEETFLRRAYLDIAGRIPTLEEYDRYSNYSGSKKRHQLIDELLDSPGYVSHSHIYWLDALRVTHVVAKNHFEPYKHWILQSIKNNMPYDEFANRLVSSEGRISDPENAAVGYYLRDDRVGFMQEERVSVIPCSYS